MRHSPRAAVRWKVPGRIRQMPERTLALRVNHHIPRVTCDNKSRILLHAAKVLFSSWFLVFLLWGVSSVRDFGTVQAAEENFVLGGRRRMGRPGTSRAAAVGFVASRQSYTSHVSAATAGTGTGGRGQRHVSARQAGSRRHINRTADSSVDFTWGHNYELFKAS